ncbi:hypothetical protein INT45_013212 [Circinella minor]|uniref:Uncharacterized protein n=1 Tax=Circinella minor TaxID=1195481 RepID=A0A8H7S180_9FUNG|nr:hypothetical protein INT45_013212 [Circinella minor]
MFTSNITILNESHPVTYQVVISPPDVNQNIVAVAIGQDIYGLHPDPMIPMLYKGVGPSSEPYRYVILDNHQNKDIIHYEQFERPAIQEAKETFHETYGRPWNKLHIPSIPRVYDFDSSHLNPVNDSFAPVEDPAASELFQEGTIATLHFKMDEENAQELHTNKYDKKVKIKGDMTFISYNDVQQFKDVSLKIGGHSSRNWAKVPYKIKIPRKSAPNGLYRRWSLKLRSESTDPTMMREKLYNDLLESTGIVAARGVYARLYINDVPIGLYYLVDDSSSASFIRETLNRNEPQNTQVGNIVQGDAGKGEYAASFGYLGDDVESYDPLVYDVKSEKDPEKKAEVMESVLDLIRFVKDYDISQAPNDKRLFREWNHQLDLVKFIRQLALEWIGGNWDAVQYSGNNFAIYQKPFSSQWTFIPMDFDYTFGNGFEHDQVKFMTGDDWPHFANNDKIHSHIWEKLKQVPYAVRFFENALKHINSRAAHPDVLLKRIDGLAYMLQRDILWDSSLERMTKGVKGSWEASEFLEHLEYGTNAQDEWIGLKQWVVEHYKAVSNMRKHEVEWIKI